MSNPAKPSNAEAMPDFDEEAIYAAAMSELKTGAVREGLWAKAFAESEGNELRSQALYIRLRVQQEQQRIRLQIQQQGQRRLQEQNTAKALAAEVEQREVVALMAVVENLLLKGYEAKKAGNGWIVREPLGGRAKLDSDASLLEYAKGKVPEFAYDFLPKGTCPRCKRIIPLASKECSHCRAVFTDAAAWKVLPLSNQRKPFREG